MRIRSVLIGLVGAAALLASALGPTMRPSGESGPETKKPPTVCWFQEAGATSDAACN